jgi:acyl-CoA hydrolase
MKLHIEAWAKRFLSHEPEKVTDAIFTFVAIDDSGRRLPPIMVQSPLFASKLTIVCGHPVTHGLRGFIGAAASRKVDP